LQSQNLSPQKEEGENVKSICEIKLSILHEPFDVVNQTERGDEKERVHEAVAQSR
jgi:hypothetical protein